MAPWPTPLPRWYWQLQIWYDNGRKGPRPKNAPTNIRRDAPWVFARYALHRAVKPKPQPVYGGLFVGDGVFLRGPGGESEDVAAMDAAEFVWVAGNIGDHHPSAWDKIRLRCTSYDLSFIPWSRAMPDGATVQQAEERTRLLARTAQQWGSRALITNLENESWEGDQPYVARFPPERVGQILKEENWGGETAVSTVGYPPSWPKWAQAGKVGLMQAFMNERQDLLPKVCVDRGKECGFAASFPTFGTYPAAHPWSAASYKALWNGPFSIYVGDEIGAAHAWGNWA